MPWDRTLPPDTRSLNSPDPADDHNKDVKALAELRAKLGDLPDAAVDSLFKWNGSKLVEIPSGTFGLTASLDVRRYGAVFDSAADASTNDQAIVDALNDLPAYGGEVVIAAGGAGGEFHISSTIDLAGFNQRIRVADDVKIMVPSGFSDTVFRFYTDSTMNSNNKMAVEGAFRINEVAPESNLWDAVEFHADTNGISFCHVGPLVATRPNSLIVYYTANGGFANGNTCEGTYGHEPVNVWDFVGTGKIRRNINMYVRVQGDPTNTAYVIRNGRGFANNWFGCNVFDADSSTTEITSAAEDFVILGGVGIARVNWNLVDNGLRTMILQGFGGDQPNTIESTHNKAVASGYAGLDANAQVPYAQLPVSDEIVLGAADFEPSVGSPTTVAVGGSRWVGWALTDATNMRLGAACQIPASWNTVDVDVFHTTLTGNQGSASSATGIFAPTAGATLYNDTASNKLNIAAVGSAEQWGEESSLVDVTAPSGSTLLRVGRQPGDAGDDLTGDWILLGVRIRRKS